MSKIQSPQNSAEIQYCKLHLPVNESWTARKPDKSDKPQFIKNLTPDNFTIKIPVIMSANNIIHNLTKSLSTVSQTWLTSPFSVRKPPNTILMEAQATNHSFGRNHLLGNCYFSVCDDYNLIQTHCKSVRLFKLTLVLEVLTRSCWNVIACWMAGMEIIIEAQSPCTKAFEAKL
jgi:hypothetical protein